MKKFAIIAVAICAAFVMSTPAMAIDADFSGYYQVRGFYDSNLNLKKDDSSSAYMDMRLRLNTVFKISDNLSLTTRLDAFDDTKWGDSDDTTGNDIDLDRVYMTIKTDIGQFDIGRMSADTFGTNFLDSYTDADSIKYTKAMGDFTLEALFEKRNERDAGFQDNNGNDILLDAGDSMVSDEDEDRYYLTGEYKAEGIAAGLQGAFVNDKTDRDETVRAYVLNPYFVTKFGQIGLQGELCYIFGDVEIDSEDDVDIKALAYNIEVSYDLDMASVELGYAYFSGDITDDNDYEGFDGGVGNDWEKLFILTTNENNYLENLGGFGNLSADSTEAIAGNYGVNLGAKIMYVGASVTPIENLKLGLVIGYAKADEVPSGVEDDFGYEYDLTLDYKIMDNLTYSAIAAYLDAGDIWKDLNNTTELENTYALFHQLQLTF